MTDPAIIAQFIEHIEFRAKMVADLRAEVAQLTETLRRLRTRLKYQVRDPGDPIDMALSEIDAALKENKQ